MSTTKTFNFANKPNPIIDKAKEWVKNNPRIARRKPEESDIFQVEVFGYNHKTVADDLYYVLESSGFLDKYPLFRIKIDPMQ
jgi:hypothetical protein